MELKKLLCCFSGYLFMGQHEITLWLLFYSGGPFAPYALACSFICDTEKYRDQCQKANLNSSQEAVTKCIVVVGHLNDNTDFNLSYFNMTLYPTRNFVN